MVRLSHVLALSGTLASVLANPNPRFARPHHPRLTKRQDINEDDRFHRSDATEDDGAVVQGAYIVELEVGISAADLAIELSAMDITIELRRTLDYKLFKGVSFDVVGAGDPEGTETAIAAADVVKNLWPVRKVSLPGDEMKHRLNMTGNPHSRDLSSRELETPYNPHVMTQVDRLHEAGFTGKGLRIAVIDTGIDYNHPILGGCYGPGCVVTYGWDAVGVDYIDDDGSIVEPDDDPMDCDGHGTHVAGIVAAGPNDFGFLGVAPDAELGAYRVLDCGGWGTVETVLMGMLRAFDDGSDIITMSLGRSGGWPEDIWSETATRIIEAGVPVFVAVGNSGEYGYMFEPGSPSDGNLVSSVASFDAVEEPTVFVVGEYAIGDSEEEQFGWTPVRLAYEDGFESETFPLIDLNTFVSGNGSHVTGCSPLPASVPDLSGYLVLLEAVDNPSCWESDQYRNVLARGGSNFMFWSPGYPPNIWPGREEGINSGVTSFSTAKLWREALAAGSNITVTLTVPEQSEALIEWNINHQTGGHVSVFSSWGPNWDLRSAPSFGAPGNNILSTIGGSAWGSDSQGVLVASGTSMSTPLVAGAAALLSQARGTLDPKTLHNLLASTSRQVGWMNLGTLRDGVTPSTHAGSGLIQLWDASQAKGLLSTSSISFNDSDHHVRETTFTLLNTGDEEATYQLGHSAALTTYARESRRFLRGNIPFETTRESADITFAAGKVTVDAGAEVEITVRCSPPEANKALWPIYSGYITLNGTNGDNLAIPYVGNAGSMRDAMMFNEHYGAYLTTGGWDHGDEVNPDTVFTVPKPSGDRPGQVNIYEDEVPIVVVDVISRSRMVRVDLIPAQSNSTSINSTVIGKTSKCNLPHEEWLGRKTYGQIWGSPLVNTVWEWMGYDRPFVGFLANGTPVPPGRYSILVSALNAFTPLSNKTEDWQFKQLVPFTIKYEEE